MNHLHVDDAYAAHKKFESLESRLEYHEPIPKHLVEVAKYEGRVALAVYVNTQRKLKNGKFVFKKEELIFVRDESTLQISFEL